MIRGMTREEAIELARRACKETWNEKICKQIRKALEPKTGHWIPVSERLPKADEYVGDVAKYYLVQNEYGDMLVARYTHSQYWEQMYQHKPYADEIVAWMPLPIPYEPQESEGT